MPDFRPVDFGTLDQFLNRYCRHAIDVTYEVVIETKLIEAPEEDKDGRS